MSFADLMSKPLPSKMQEVDESVDDMTEDATLGDDCVTGAPTESGEDATIPPVEADDPATVVATGDTGDEPVPSDVGLDELSDAELEQLVNELDDEELDDVVDVADDVEDLSPSEDAEADDMMAAAATTQLVQNEMSAEERAAFAESKADIQIAINEGLILESDFADDAEGEPVTEAKWFANRQRIELGKEARMRQLWSLAVMVEARAHRDPDYARLQKVYRSRRILRRKLEKKYNASAKKRMMVYINRLKKSKSGLLAKIGAKFGK